jgi:hypothetical protein
VSLSGRCKVRTRIRPGASSPLANRLYNASHKSDPRARKVIAPRHKRRIGLLIPAIAAAIGIGTWLTNWTLDHKCKQRFEANLVRITELLALPEELAPAAKFDAVRVLVHRHSRHGRDSSAFRKLIGRNELITEALISHATDQNSEPLQAECSIRSNLMAAVLGFKTRIVYLFDTDGKDGDKLRSHTFVDVLNPATEEWESHDPDYNLYWRCRLLDRALTKSQTSGSAVSLRGLISTRHSRSTAARAHSRKS